MSLKVSHIKPKHELLNVVHSLFVMEYDEQTERADFLLPSGRSAFFYIETDEEFYVEYDGLNRKSLVDSGFYLACIDNMAKYSHKKIRVVGASIHPIYLGLLFRIKPKDILNNFTRLDTIDKLEGNKLPLPNIQLKTLDVVDSMEAFMNEQLENNPIRVDVERIYKRIVNTNAFTITVTDLAEWMGYTERHIVNIFKEYVGLSPKRFIQLTRFNESLKMLDKMKDTDKLSDIAYQMGYHDQAHFSRDFKSFCGKTPKELQNERSSIAYLLRQGF
ncbi:helix-turn-helix domain-containing protein [Roseivirga seohaensis]|uniref:helix-turn-helix domain-containing protein n=1 Tax=Roseivirga seohaensis TaxID=1914963 RepID=UPI00069CE926|nr:helix-turn-helix domain-containing protein [Roseivirga seohaensis]